MIVPGGPSDTTAPSSPWASIIAQAAAIPARPTSASAAPAASTAPGANWTTQTRPTSGWASWNNVPIGDQNQLVALADLWEQSIGFQVSLSSDDLLAMANASVLTQRDLGQYVMGHWGSRFGTVLTEMPWAQYGLGKDEYATAANIYATEYKKLTGQDIGSEALRQAFQNPRDPTGGLLSASQYTQQLMNDASIQKTYGWVRYGLDFSQWTQQKLSLRSAFGRDIQDAEAQTILQYNRTAAGANMSVLARQTGERQSQAPALGVAESVVR